MLCPMEKMTLSHSMWGEKVAMLQEMKEVVLLALMKKKKPLLLKTPHAKKLLRCLMIKGTSLSDRAREEESFHPK